VFKLLSDGGWVFRGRGGNDCLRGAAGGAVFKAQADVKVP
jgi:hypothetical protein